MPVSSKEVSAELTLWRSVIDQSIHDLGHKDPRIAEEAIEWLDLHNENFLDVCELAEVNPQKVLKFVHKNLHRLTERKLNG